MKYLFVSYNMGIWVHSFPEALIADTLRKAGHEVKFLHCDRVFNQHCTTMSACSIKQEDPQEKKDFACNECSKNKSITKKYFNFETFEVSSFISQEDRKKVHNLISEVTPNNFQEFTYEGVALGKTVLYESLINFKKSSLDFKENEFEFYRIYLTNALLSLIAFIKLYELEKPDSVVIYSCEYATNYPTFSYAKLNGSNSYSIFAGHNLSHRLQTLIILKGSYWDLKKRVRDRWNHFKSIPISEKGIRRVTDHFITLFRSNSIWAYSTRKESNFSTRSFFKIKPNRKIIAITMSSYDELFASYASGYQDHRRTYGTLFTNQLEWVKCLIDFAKLRPDLHFIFRVHPREFPNKREQGLSTQATILLELFKSLPENCSVNWPDQSISLYDLVEEVDLILNSHSTTGVELAFMGHSVVLYDPTIVHYPPDINYYDPNITIDGYFKKIDEAMKIGWSFENIRNAYRWLHFWHNRISIDISDGVYFNDSEKPRLTIKQRLLDRFIQKYFPSKSSQIQSFFRPWRLKESKKIRELFQKNLDDFSYIADKRSYSLESETENIKKSLLEIYNIFYPPGNEIRENTLHYNLAKLLKIKM